MSTVAPPPAWLDEVEPTYEGQAGRAYRCEGVRDQVIAEGDPTAITGIVQWLLHVPGAHPFWSWWALNAIHLRDVPGMPPANKHYPGAEYELLVVALNPEHPAPDPRRVPEDGLKFLTPVDVCEQFHDVPGGDEKVRELIELFAKAVCDGALSPDQDFRPLWRRYLDGTLDHFRKGLH